MILTIALPEDVMIQAAQDFFASEWASAREEAGFRFGPATNLNDECPHQDEAKLLELVRPYVARLAEAWGMDVTSEAVLVKNVGMKIPPTSREGAARPERDDGTRSGHEKSPIPAMTRRVGLP